MQVTVLGTGQLALMLAKASQNLGIEMVAVGEANSRFLPKYCQIHHCLGPQLKNQQALLQNADVISFESENVVLERLPEAIAKEKFHPSLDALKIFQNRFYEKNFLLSQGLNTAKYLPLFEPENVALAQQYIGFPSVFKPLANGYDGRGQQRVEDINSLTQCFQTSSQAGLLEQWQAFEQEVSLIAVRGRDGQIVFYPLTQNHHRDGQLRLSLVASEHPLQSQAEQAAAKVMENLDYIGCMVMEFFVVNGQLVVNEVAPRVHNSGHWTIEGASSSQFEQHLKAITGQAIETPSIEGPVAMVNCIGTVPNLGELAQEQNIFVHDYGKQDKPERKVGHITVLKGQQTQAAFYQQVAKVLKACNEKELAEAVALPPGDAA